jgi:FkbM family methyltransferase
MGALFLFYKNYWFNFLKGRKERDFFSAFIRRGDLVFDVGANVGDKTAVFASIGARVVAIEPQRSCVAFLKNRFMNNFSVTILETALGSSEGAAELHICEEVPTISTISEKWIEKGRFSHSHSWNQKDTIPVTTLDALISRFGVPSYIKIDVEGYEEEVMKGLTVTCKCISFEFTKEFLEDAKDCLSYLETLGTCELNCSLGESLELYFSEWTDAQGLFSCLQSIDESNLWGDIYVRYRIR